eukprot:gene30571-34700_t
MVEPRRFHARFAAVSRATMQAGEGWPNAQHLVEWGSFAASDSDLLTASKTPPVQSRRRLATRPMLGRDEMATPTMAANRKTPEDLRSHRWFGATDLRSFGHRSRILQMGYAHEEFLGKPVIAIINTWSDINPCHQHLRLRAEEVKRGVLMAGGFPIELPAMSLAENF